jgi:hypothetical protein
VCDVHPSPSLEIIHAINGGGADGDGGARGDRLLLAGTN